MDYFGPIFVANKYSGARESHMSSCEWVCRRQTYIKGYIYYTADQRKTIDYTRLDHDYMNIYQGETQTKGGPEIKVQILLIIINN